MSNEKYAHQHRGDLDAYASYFAGMEKSAQQKVALTTAHFPSSGTLVDMGCGSGKTTHDLASLYAGLALVGVDVNPVTVAWASQHYVRPNLSFVAGDIADPLFAPGTLTGILDSSVLHHVTSFNGFSNRRLEDLCDHQVAALQQGGVLVVRDFVVPEGPAEVVLEVATDDGAETGPVPQLSTAALFEKFAQEFRSSLNLAGPVPYARVECPVPGRARFRVSLRAATEFILRKDYREDWAAELLEEYTYWRQAEFEAALSHRNMRVAVSVPIWNPWIIENRMQGRVRLFDGERELAFPATNYLVVGEKVGPGRGVKLVEASQRTLEKPSFLSIERWREKGTGQVWELVRRPNPVLDLLPWFDRNGHTWLIARDDFPRPITNARTESVDPSSMHVAGWVTEPIAATILAGEDPNAAIARVLSERAGIASTKGISTAHAYYPSPGGIAERVEAYLVELDSWAGDHAAPNLGSFSESGQVRAFEATQLLRASHVGGMFDARLEINAYRLLRSQGRSLGPWIGASLKSTAEAGFDVPVSNTASTLSMLRRSNFEEAGPGEAAYLEVREGRFEERAADGQVLSSATYEYVLPRTGSHVTATALPFVVRKGLVFVGLETRDLPAVQRFEGTSGIVTVPAWRMKRSVTDLLHLERSVVSSLSKDFGVEAARVVPLGGAYRPSMGVTPELVFPFAVQVKGAGKDLSWVPLAELLAQAEAVRDAHLLVAMHRLAHAFEG